MIFGITSPFQLKFWEDSSIVHMSSGASSTSAAPESLSAGWHSDARHPKVDLSDAKIEPSPMSNCELSAQSGMIDTRNASRRHRAGICHCVTPIDDIGQLAEFMPAGACWCSPSYGKKLE
jgi:hypothetical protein